MSSNQYLDPNKSSADILTDLINQSNADDQSFVPFPYSYLTFQNAKEHTLDVLFDSEVQVTDNPAANPAVDSEWFKFFYSRSPITAVIHRKDMEPVMPYNVAYSTVHDMLADINIYFGLGLSTADVEDTVVPASGSWPRPVQIKAKSGSLIYQGETTLYVDDPTSPKFGLATISTNADSAIDAGFDRGGGVPTDHYQVIDNSEVEVASSCYLQPGDVSPTISTNVYTVDFNNDKHWTYVGSVGLYSQPTANVASLYIIELTIKKGTGQIISKLRLSKKEDDSIGLLSQDLAVWIPVSFVGGSDLIQFQFSPVDYFRLFSAYVANAHGSVIGEFQFELTAMKRHTALPAVSSKIIVRPNIEAVAKVNLQSDVQSVALSDSADTHIPFKANVKVSTQAGLNYDLATNVDYTVELTATVGLPTVPPDSHGISVSNTTFHLPAGLNPGYYELTGEVVIPTGWDAVASPTATLTFKNGATPVTSISWSLH